MNAPQLWVFVPLAAGLLLMLLSSLQWIMKLTALLICFLLGSIALLIPINSMIIFGSQTSLVFTDSMSILGRQLILSRNQQPLLICLFLLAAFWILASLTVRTHRFQIPVLMMQTGLSIGMIAVRPLSFSIYFILLLTILPMPILWTQRELDGSGLMRTMFSQILGVTFLGIGFWLMDAVSLNTADTMLIQRTVLMMLIGFIFLLGIFPFHNWLVMLIMHYSSFSVGFTVSLQQFSVFYLLLKILNEYSWIRTYSELYSGMVAIGLVMLLFGGLMALFSALPKRLFAALVLAENGISLVAVGMKNERGLIAAMTLLVLRLLVTLVWAYIDQTEQDSQQAYAEAILQGEEQAPSLIDLSAARLLVYFVLAGMPLSLAFPEKIALLSTLSTVSAQNGLLLGIGMLLLLVSGAHLFRRLLVGNALIPTRKTIPFGVLVAVILLLALGLLATFVKPAIALLLAPFNAILS